MIAGGDCEPANDDGDSSSWQFVHKWPLTLLILFSSDGFALLDARLHRYPAPLWLSSHPAYQDGLRTPFSPTLPFRKHNSLLALMIRHAPALDR